ncbi:PepSY-associated TM helix domain-containing protein [Acinetobacter sichuanensis]|uniref:PepSY-associated TM helix domain-containing protein n=1 Tax=Acinetobacter sichuanensis TaxID=2136183 RepID=UPI00280DD530|nr:PepSY-associated TM helix domain-containing protein [Acinetobacter sichuanensis]MDQ9022483.1 PepSY-associated TM helix domain-containing protein [Acinetobacter sichuanensis]
MYQKRDFYRHARYVHGWLSAFAFLVLIFFSITGIFLNHPEWFEPAKKENTSTISLPDELLAEIKAKENPSDLILNYIRQQQADALIGRYQSSEVLDGEIMIHLESPTGSSDVWVTLDTAEMEISSKPASTISLINDLHRGKNSGTAWRWLIDISAILITILSLAGFILFLSIKTRLITHLVLIASSIVLFMWLIWAAI